MSYNIIFSLFFRRQMEAADRLTKIRRAFNLSDNEPIPDNIILNEINWNCKIHFYYEIHKIKSMTKNTKIFQNHFYSKPI